MWLQPPQRTLVIRLAQQFYSSKHRAWVTAVNQVILLIRNSCSSFALYAALLFEFGHTKIVFADF